MKQKLIHVLCQSAPSVPGLIAADNTLDFKVKHARFEGFLVDKQIIEVYMKDTGKLLFAIPRENCKNWVYAEEEEPIKVPKAKVN
jgi:hypothetical protein